MPHGDSIPLVGHTCFDNKPSELLLQYDTVTHDMATRTYNSPLLFGRGDSIRTGNFSARRRTLEIPTITSVNVRQ